MIINFLIIIHELGHTLVGLLFKVKINKIIIYPLGGITKFEMPININKYKELLILIAGPLFQYIAYIILLSLFSNYSKMINYYHFNILLFNLLPIYPLDGGKIINILLSEFIPFKKSLQLSIKISYIIVVIFLFKLEQNYINIIIMELLLVVLIYNEYKKIDYVYNKFLLERYLNNYNFRKINIIKNINNFYRDRRHLLKNNEKYYTEQQILIKKYKK